MKKAYTLFSMSKRAKAPLDIIIYSKKSQNSCLLLGVTMDNLFTVFKI